MLHFLIAMGCQYLGSLKFLKKISIIKKNVSYTDYCLVHNI